MKIYSNINDKCENYYKTRFHNDSNYSKIGWKNELSQEIRFQQLMRNFNLKEGATINDLGCGLGDLQTYIAKNTSLHFEYRGYDIIEFMIDESNKLFEGNKSVTFYKIDENNEMLQADFTVASGIFNLKYDANDAEWKQYILETITTMFEKSSIGCAFNCLTSYSDKEYMRDELFYSNPLELFDFCKTNLSKNVALMHDYGEFDFTISVLK